MNSIKEILDETIAAVDEHEEKRQKLSKRTRLYGRIALISASILGLSILVILIYLATQ